MVLYHYIYRFEASLALCILGLIFVDTFFSMTITITYSLIDIYCLFSMSFSFILQYHSNVVVDKVAIAQIFLHAWIVFLSKFFTDAPNNFARHWRHTTFATEAFLQMQTLTTQNTFVSTPPTAHSNRFQLFHDSGR
jgi:hypothetical protein